MRQAAHVTPASFFCFMTFRVLIVGILLLILSSACNAQQHIVTATATVDMTMKPNMGLAAARNMSMGTVTQGLTSIDVNPITGGNAAAYFAFSAPPNTPVTVSYAFTSLSNGPSTIDFNGLLAGSEADNQTKSSIILNGSTIVTNSDGGFHFWAGGSAKLSRSQQLGIYTGTFVLTITY